MNTPRKPPSWFKWAIWAGIALAILVPSACVLNHGKVPGYGTFHLWEEE